MPRLDGGDPGNAILLNGLMQTARRGGEIGVPGFQTQVLISTSEFRLIANPGRCRRIELHRFPKANVFADSRMRTSSRQFLCGLERDANVKA
jgi:hypothetical protein